jgi:outer membrane protein
MTGRHIMSSPLNTILHAVLLVALFWGFAAPNVQAQQVRDVSFNEAVQIALERNVTILRAKNNLDLQELTVKSEKMDFLPNFNMSSGANRNYGLQFDQTTGRLVNASNDGFNLSASSSISLFAGFSNVATLAGARATLEAQEFSYERTRQTVVFNVISNYLNVILAEETIQIRQEDVESQTKLLEQIEEFVRVGTRAISDSYNQQATLANAEAQLLNAESNYQVSKTRLIQVLHLDPLSDYNFLAPDAAELSVKTRTYVPQDLLLAAFERRADLRAQEFSIEAAEQSIRSAKSGSLPTLSMSTSASSSYSSNGQSNFNDQLDNNRSERVGINLSIPIFNRFNTKRNIEASKVQYANARLDLENLQQNVAIEVRQAYLDYQTAVKRLEVTQKGLQASDQALQVEQERYNVGASTLVELTQARSRFVDSASQRAQAVFQFHFQHRVIEYYLGTLDPGQPLFN